MPFCYPHSPRVRIICIYFFTTILLTTIIYTIISSHLQLAVKMNTLETDMKHIFKEVGLITHELFHTKGNGKDSLPPCLQQGGGNELTSDQVEMMVRRHINKVQLEWMQTQTMVETIMNRLDKKAVGSNEDQSYRTDYALESLGAQVADVQHTPYTKTNFFLSLFGIEPVQNEPGNIIRPSMSPGDCYAFTGSSSVVTIKLMTEIFIDSITIHHIPENLSPTGNIASAPKDFSVYGLKTLTDSRPFFFGSYTYDIRAGKPTQVFIFFQIATEAHRYVQIRFQGNSGHKKFTCVYRISVHGRLEQSDSNQKDEIGT